MPPDVIKRLDRDLRKLFPKPTGPRLLWHYTTAEAFQAIAKGERLPAWTVLARRATRTNDRREIVHAHDVLANEFAGLAARSPLAKRAWAEYCKRPMHQFDIFVFALSRAEDDASQWHRYGGGNKGVSLGFRARHFPQFPGSAMVPLIYGVQDQARIVRTQLDRVCATTARHAAKHPRLRASIDEKCIEFLMRAAAEAAMKFKHSSFRAEREVRWLYVPELAWEIPRERRLPGLMFNHEVRLALPLVPLVPARRMPLEHVMLARQCPITKREARRLVANIEHPVHVSRSTCPLRI